MHHKVTKALLKFVLFFPFGFALSFLITSFEVDAIFSHLLWGGVGSFLLLFYNWFEYSKFDEMKVEDFLESKHTHELEDDSQIWQKIQEVFQQQLNGKVTSESDQELQVVLITNFNKSIVTAIKKEKWIQLSIKRKGLWFLPDRADNYVILQKLLRLICEENSDKKK